MAKKNVNTAANPAAGASTAAALAAAQNTPVPPDAPKGRPGKQWVCLEDCLLADGFHYRDSVVTAAVCPPHFGPVPEPPERDE
ncbi:MAG: hypothetical protein LBK27_05555 [Treponema sp.]|nr:hypothetical protein [Treponema sp.]